MSYIKSHPLDVKQRHNSKVPIIVKIYEEIVIGISTSLSMDSFNFMKLSS